MWSWADDLKGNIFSPWIQVKSSAMKVDSGLVMVAIPVATGKPFYFLDLAVEAFPQRIGNAMFGIGYDVVDVGVETLGGLVRWTHLSRHFFHKVKLHFGAVFGFYLCLLTP